MSQVPPPAQPPTLHAETFCVNTIEIVRAHMPTIVQNLQATAELIVDTPGPSRPNLRPHVTGLVDTGMNLGRRLHRAVDLALHTLAERNEGLDRATVVKLQLELLEMAEDLGGLLVRLSAVDAQLDCAD